MLFKNANVVFENIIKKCDVLTNGEIIAEIGENLSHEDCEIIDCENKYLIPGLIDLHVHGGGGYSAMGSPDDILNMAKAHRKNGVTSILPTTLADTPERLCEYAENVRTAIKKDPSILGIHFEGPFLSKKMCGAQDKSKLLSPADIDYRSFIEKNSDILKMTGIAPELDGALELGDLLKEKGIIASIAHSSDFSDTFNEAIKHGFTDVTHIFNACTVCKKEGAFRIAGTVEAALANDEVTVQVIADLRHLPKEILKLIYKAKGDRKMYLISDGLEFSASDIPEGTEITQKNGVKAVYKNKAMLLADGGALAGSAASGIELVRNMHFKIGVPLYSAVRMMTLTPAEIIGAKNKGQIKAGNDADILLTDKELNIEKVIKAGI